MVLVGYLGGRGGKGGYQCVHGSQISGHKVGVVHAHFARPDECDGNRLYRPLPVHALQRERRWLRNGSLADYMLNQ